MSLEQKLTKESKANKQTKKTDREIHRYDPSVHPSIFYQLHFVT